MSVPLSSTYDIKPAAGAEWVIHNMYAAAYVELFVTDGTNTFKFDSLAADARMGMVTHLTSTYWLRISNSSTTTAVLVAYDGMQTK